MIVIIKIFTAVRAAVVAVIFALQLLLFLEECQLCGGRHRRRARRDRCAGGADEGRADFALAHALTVQKRFTLLVS